MKEKKKEGRKERRLKVDSIVLSSARNKKKINKGRRK